MYGIGRLSQRASNAVAGWWLQQRATTGGIPQLPPPGPHPPVAGPPNPGLTPVPPPVPGPGAPQPPALPGSKIGIGLLPGAGMGADSGMGMAVPIILGVGVVVVGGFLLLRSKRG